MSTQLQIMISDCPDNQAAALTAVLVNNELSVDWDEDCGGPGAVLGELHIGHAFYTSRSTSGDASGDIANQIIAAAPDARFTAWTDPAEDYLGMLVRYTPALGRHDADCDIDGQAVFREDEILRALDSAGMPGIHRLVGSRWTAALTGQTVERTIRVSAED